MSGGPERIERRRSERLSTSGSPYLTKRRSSTLGIAETLASNSLDTGEAGSEVSAASSRAKFAQMAAEAAKPAPDGKQVVQKAKFDRKLAIFESGGVSARAEPAAVSARGVRNKLAAFEQVAATKTEPEVKQTWKKGPGTSYAKKTCIGDGVAPKKSLADLP